MIYKSLLKSYYLERLSLLLFFIYFFSSILQIPVKSLNLNVNNSSSYKFEDNFKFKLRSILNKDRDSKDNFDSNPFDAFFSSLKDVNLMNGEEYQGGVLNYENRKNDFVLDEPQNIIDNTNENSNQNFDWGTSFKLLDDANVAFLDLKKNNMDSESYITKSFLGFFNNIKNGNNELKKKESKKISFKELVIPQLMSSVNNDELEGAARGILMNELLLETEIGKAIIPRNRPDGLPSMIFIGLESDIMPLNVSYQKKGDKFVFKTFPNFTPPDIPKIAGQRLKKWVMIKYKQIYDKIAEKSLNDEENRNLLNSINKYGIFFAIEFKDDVVCHLSEVTLYRSVQNNKSEQKNYVSRVSRILFSRLRPFIPLMSTFIPLEISEFRSLSFIGSPVLMLKAHYEDDIFTQQALYYWSFESEKILQDYNRKDHVCNEKELYQNPEYHQLCIIHPKDKDPRNYNTFNNGYLTTVSCFGLYPIGTMALFIRKSLYSLRICQKDGKWSDTKILSDQDRATIILHKCHSRNSQKESFYNKASSASFFENS